MLSLCPRPSPLDKGGWRQNLPGFNAKRPPQRLRARVVRQFAEQFDRPPFRAEPGAARLFARRPEELHLLEPELDADVVAGAGLAEAGADTVEFAEDRRSVVQSVSSTMMMFHGSRSAVSFR